MLNVKPIPNQQPGVFATAINDKGQLVHQTPAQLHPVMISGDGVEAKYTRQVFGEYSDKLAALNSMWMRRDPRLKEEVSQYRGEALDNARADMKAAIKRHEDALRESTGFKVDANLRGLVTGSFQQMTPAQRSQALDALLAEGNGGALAILDELSPVFTGLAPEQRAIIQERLFLAHDPATYAALKTAKGNLDRIEQASLTMVRALNQFASGPDVSATPPAEEVRSVASGFAA